MRVCVISRQRAAAFTLIEILLGVAIVAVLVALALPAYSDYSERRRVSQAIQDLVVLNAVIKNYQFDNNAYPTSLTDVGAGGRLDPWGRPYVYFPLDSVNQGKARKNKNLVPINSDFDLYSLGKDGESMPPLNAKDSRDDVIRAYDGRFHGLASNFE
jgi:general secretion pathway protein G